MADHEGTHKDMVVGEPLDADAWQIMLAGQQLRFDGDPLTAGGLVRNAAGIASEFVRPPGYRADPAQLSVSDVLPLYNGGAEHAANKPLAATTTGSELELMIYDPEQHEMAPVMAVGHRFRDNIDDRAADSSRELFGRSSAAKLSYGEELADFHIELNFNPQTERAAKAIEVVRSLQVLAHVIESEGARLLPLSTLPHRLLTDADISQSPYLQRMAYDVLGGHNARAFSCASLQGHSEMLQAEAGLFALNQLQHVSHVLYGLTLAAPFTHGDPSGLSGRYDLRVAHSPSGGIYPHPLPENLEKYYDLVEQQLKAGETPSAARGGGQHRDRPRFDTPPHATIENCEADTAGGMPLRMLSTQHLKDVVVWKLQRLHLTGQTEQLARYPALFTKATDASMQLAHHNTRVVARYGLRGLVEGQDGYRYSGHDLFEQLLEFADEPVTASDGTVLWDGFPPAIKKDLRLAASAPDRKDFTKFRTAGIVDIRGFYEDGIGTIAHWVRQRHQELRRQQALRGHSFDNRTAILDTMDNTAASYHQHLHNITAEQIALQFSLRSAA